MKTIDTTIDCEDGRQKSGRAGEQRLPKLSRFRDAFVGYHYLLGAAVAGIYALLVYQGHYALLAGLDQAARNSFYLSLAATSGVLLGFSITAVAIFLSMGESRGLNLLRDQPVFQYTRTVLMGAIYALGLSTVAMTTMILLDSQIHPHRLLEIVAVAVAAVAFFRTWAVVWLLNRLLRLATT